MRKFLLLAAAFFMCNTAFSQNISDFDAQDDLSLTLVNVTAQSGSTISPAGNTFGNPANGGVINNATGVITTSAITTTNVSTFTFDLASLAGTSGNGAEASDEVIVAISTDGGTNFSDEIEIEGNSNAKWTYAGGGGSGSTIYDGDNTAVVVGPAGGGVRDDDGDGIAEVTVSAIPAGNIVIQITAMNNSANEFWALDNLTLTEGSGSADPIVSFSVSTQTVSETDGAFLATVNISEDPTADVVVNVTSTDGTAVAGSDFDAVNETLTFTPGGGLSQNVTVNLIDDGDIEMDETFTLSISINSGMATAGGDQTITVESNDNDCPPIGDVFITEIMQNPAAVGDGSGEYFELFNSSGTDVDIEGWILSDEGTDNHIINNGAPLLVPANSYIVLGNNADMMTNGGVVVDYEYSGFTLANGDDEIILTCAGGPIMDQVDYDGGTTFPDPDGASMILNKDNFTATFNNDGENWCTSTSTIGAMGDLGTPGAINDDCLLPIYDVVEAMCLNADGYTSGNSPADGFTPIVYQGELIAEVNRKNNDLGDVNTQFYIEDASGREDADGTNYLDRSWFINTTAAPTGPENVVIRLYFTQAEFDRLVADAAGDSDAPVTVDDLGVTKVDNLACADQMGDFGESGITTTTFIPGVVSDYGMGNYYIEFEVDGFSGFFLNAGGSALPVEMTSFTAELNEEVVGLNWTTASEEDNSHFEVQRSSNGIDWSVIGEVAGNGTTDQAQAYSFTDLAPAAGTNLYRLQQIDFGGTSAYSDIVVVEVGAALRVIATDGRILEVFTPSNGVLNYQIYSTNGQLVDTGAEAAQRGNTTIDVSNSLSRGLYFVQIQLNGEQVTYKLVK